MNANTNIGLLKTANTALAASVVLTLEKGQVQKIAPITASGFQIYLQKTRFAEQFKALDPAGRTEVIADFKAKLVLEDKAKETLVESVYEATLILVDATYDYVTREREVEEVPEGTEIETDPEDIEANTAVIVAATAETTDEEPEA